jgi:hypothetical protein
LAEVSRDRPFRSDLSARTLVLRHRVSKPGPWKGFSGAPTAAKAAVGYLYSGNPVGYVLSYLWERVSRRRGFLLLLFSPLVLIVVLRYSGTDTYGVYEVALWHTFRTGLPTGFEAGFDALFRSLLGLTGSPVWAVKGVGVLFGFLLALFLSRSDPLERRFFFLLLRSRVLLPLRHERPAGGPRSGPSPPRLAGDEAEEVSSGLGTCGPGSPLPHLRLGSRGPPGRGGVLALEEEGAFGPRAPGPSGSLAFGPGGRSPGGKGPTLPGTRRGGRWSFRSQRLS